jgi:hypothetical protein
MMPIVVESFVGLKKKNIYIYIYILICHPSTLETSEVPAISLLVQM